MTEESRQGATVRIALPAQLTRTGVAKLREKFLGALEKGGTLEIDAASVTEVDGPGIQLLLSTRRSAEARGGSFTLVHLREEIGAALQASRAWELLGG